MANQRRQAMHLRVLEAAVRGEVEELEGERVAGEVALRLVWRLRVRLRGQRMLMCRGVITGAEGGEVAGGGGLTLMEGASRHCSGVKVCAGPAGGDE